MQTKHVYRRLTHKYHDGYKNLDRHEFFGTAVLGASRMVREPRDFDDGGTYVRLATLPAGMNSKQRKEFREALAENLSKWGCRHEYDCCGCELTRTTVHATNHARKAVVVTNVSYNY